MTATRRFLASVLLLAMAGPVNAQTTYFRRGDSNGDGNIELSDAIFTLSNLYLGTAGSKCDDASDANDDGQVDLSDAVFTLGALFLGTATLPAPGMICGYDPTEDKLYCGECPTCEQPLFPFSVVDGLAVVEGDIILGRAEDMPFQINLQAPGDGGEGGGFAVGNDVDFTFLGLKIGTRWTGGVVPFRFDSVTNGGVPQATRDRLQQAMKHIADRTVARFIPRTTESDFVTFQRTTDSRICGASPVGRALLGGEGVIVIHNDCDVGGMIHELCHTLGLWHEQTRPDRDSFVKIHFENIIPELKFNFDKQAGVTIGNYDFGSIMHYPSWAFVRDDCHGCVAIETIPPGMPIGQRTGLSTGDVDAVAALYGPGPCAPSNALKWKTGGNTAALGSLLQGQKFWTGDFNGDGRDDVLFYSPGDRNWWCGTYTGSQITWNKVGNTAGFGNLLEGQVFWSGRFSRFDREEVLFYFPDDQNWWLGTYAGGHLNWTSAGNTSGFGNLLEGQMFWTGRFSRSDRTEVLFYFPGDQNWWLGTYAGGQLTWTSAGNTAGFGDLLDGQKFWTGDLSGDGRDDVLFYYPVDKNWWLGSHDGTQLKWTLAGNTAGFGNLLEGQIFWIGDFNGKGGADVLFYHPLDQNWWLGSYDGVALQWSCAGNTSGFGNLLDGQMFWTGDFNADGRDDVLFYYPGDKNWWIGSK